MPFPSPGELPDPGIEPRSPALQADTLPSEPPGKPYTVGRAHIRIRLVSLLEKENLDTQAEDCHVKMEAEIRVMLPQAQYHLGPLDAGRGLLL